MTSYKKRTGGFIDYYANTSKPTDYLLNKDISSALPASTQQEPAVYVPPNSAINPSSTPLSSSGVPLNNMTGGNNKMCGRNGYKDCDVYEFDNADSFLYSFKGGCACSASSLMGGSQYSSSPSSSQKVSGGAFALTPYVTAISLLAARLLTDKQIGFFPMSGGSKSRRARK